MANTQPLITFNGITSTSLDTIQTYTFGNNIFYRAREHRQHLLDYSSHHLHTHETLHRRLNYSFTPKPQLLPDDKDDVTGRDDENYTHGNNADDLALPGLAVVVHQMVFGSHGRDSGTGVAFSRDPNSGAKELYGYDIIALI